ncbi:MAG TPA: hypothetical protein VF483_07170, partial [Gemmatimonadaceae bacterium]
LAGVNRPLLIALVGLCVAAESTPAAFAQTVTDPTDLGGFRAMLYTPVGALPTVILVKNSRDSSHVGWMAVQFGQYKERSTPFRFTNYGVTAQFKVWHGVALGGTYGYHTCTSGCSGENMGSLDASGVIAKRSGKLPDDADTEIGWLVTAGYGKFTDQNISASSLSLVLPMTVMLPQPYEGKLTLSLIPAIGYGRLVDHTGLVVGAAGTFGSVRGQIGAGVGYFFPMGLGLHLTVHRIAMAESATQSGLVASWRF